MALIYAGIDEAGYGPMLGPLVVARSVWRVSSWSAGSGAPDLWALLDAAVCRKPNDKPSGRIALNDSKLLKRSNDSSEPLEHLQRGVLAALAVRRGEAARPMTDGALFETLGVEVEPHSWYGGSAMTLPNMDDSRAATLGIDANFLGTAMADAGVELLELHVVVVGETAFNQVIASEGNKAATTGTALALHLRHLWSEHADPRASVEGGPRVVCDRQGGRADYRGPIGSWLPGVGVCRVVEHSEARSRYHLVTPGDGPIEREMVLSFQSESEREHLPIALASMAAKYVRELLMRRFNRYWSARAAAVGVELKPTAGYVQDARRWLADTNSITTPRERAAMIRRA